MTGKQLLELRKSAKLSQFRLAVVLGVAPRTISGWETETHPIDDLRAIGIEHKIKEYKKAQRERGRKR